MVSEQEIQELISQLMSINRKHVVEARNKLLKIGKPAVEPLVNLLVSTTVPVYLRYAIHILEDIMDKRAVEGLVALLVTTNYREVRESASFALVNFAGKYGINTIVNAFMDFQANSPNKKNPGKCTSLYRVIMSGLREERRAMERGMLNKGKPKIPAKSGNRLFRVQRAVR